MIDLLGWGMSVTCMHCGAPAEREDWEGGWCHLRCIPCHEKAMSWRNLRDAWPHLRLLFACLAQVGLAECLVLAEGQWLSHRGYKPPFKIALQDMAMTLGYEVPR